MTWWKTSLCLALFCCLLVGSSQAQSECLEALASLANDPANALQILQGSGKYPGDWGYWDSCRLAKNAHYCMNTFTLNVTALMSLIPSPSSSSSSSSSASSLFHSHFSSPELSSFVKDEEEQWLLSRLLKDMDVGLSLKAQQLHHQRQQLLQPQEETTSLCSANAKAKKGGGLAVTTLSLDWGLCLPQACTQEEVYLLFESLASASRGVILQEPLETVCTIPGERKELSAGAAVVVFLLCLLGLLLVVGSVIDYVKHYMNGSLQDRALNWIPLRRDAVAPRFEDEDFETVSRQQRNKKLAAEDSSPDLAPLPRSFSGFLMCWSAFYNTRKLLLPSPDDSLASLNGIRTLSMGWIVLGHSLVYVLRVGYDNLEFLFHEMQNKWTWQLFLSAPLAVDTFFFIAGFLLGFLSLKELKKTRGRFNWFLYYFHRVWRLSPLYFFLLFVYWKLAPSLGSGPKFHSAMDAYCDEYWWTNLLYIQNFYPTELNKECMNWTWYLANDMQFYILTPLILFPFHRWVIKRNLQDGTTKETRIGEIISWTILLSLFVGCIVANLGLIVHYDGDAWPMSSETMLSGVLYTKPYIRAISYLLGLIFAFVMSYETVASSKPHPVVAAGLISLAVLLISLCVFPSYDLWHHSVVGQRGSWNLAQNVFYATFSRVAWTVALCILTYVCAVGRGGALNWALGHYIWTPMARLTYCAYLIHPIIIVVYAGKFVFSSSPSSALLSCFLCQKQPIVTDLHNDCFAKTA
ncbi:Transmembrane protein NRF-6, variant 2 [Balamuthia mandrillaris]